MDFKLGSVTPEGYHHRQAGRAVNGFQIGVSDTSIKIVAGADIAVNGFQIGVSDTSALGFVPHDQL